MKKRKYAKIKVTVNGETVRRSIAYYTVDEYIKKRDAILADAEAATHPTFARAAEEWWNSYESTVSPVTRKNRASQLGKILEDLNDVNTADISARMIDGLLQEWASQRYCAGILKERLSIIRMILRKQFESGRLPSNPADACKVPKNAVKGRRTIPQGKDAAKIVAAASAGESDEMALLFAFLLYTGMRLGEALAVRHEDINRESKTISVHAHVIYADGAAQIVEGAKTAAGVRTVPLLAPLEDILPKSKSGLLFPGKNGPMTPSEYRHKYIKYAERIGITCTAHQLRHLFCTIAYEAGIEARDLMDIMGHSSITVTANIYTEIRRTRQSSTAAKLNEFFLKNGP